MVVNALDLIQRSLPVAARRQPTTTYQMTPQEQQSLIGRVGGATIGGISAAGNLLDLIPSMARDVLAGQDPLDQLRTPFRSENRAMGRDVLRHHGLIGRRNTWGNFAAGLATEIALDPLTYLTFGGSALSRAGKVARAAGMMDEITPIARELGKAQGKRAARMTTTLGDVLQARPAARPQLERAAAGMGTTLEALSGQRLGGLAGYNIPFTGISGMLGGQRASRAAQMLGAGMDVAGEALMRSAPIRYTRGLFDPRVQGRFDVMGQELAETAYRRRAGADYAARTASEQAGDQLDTAYANLMGITTDDVFAMRGRLAKIEQKNRQLVAQAGRRTPQLIQPDPADAALQTFEDMVRHTAERNANEAMQLFGPGNLNLQQQAQLYGTLTNTANELVNIKNRAFQRVQELGGDITELMPESEAFGVKHFPRYADRAALEETMREAARLTPSRTAINLARSKETRDVPREIVNRMLADQNVRVSDVDQAAQYILNNYTNFLNPQYPGITEEYAAKTLRSWVERNANQPWFLRLARGTTKNIFDDVSLGQQGMAIEQHARDLARWVQRHGKRPLYQPGRTGDDIGRYLRSAGRLEQSLEAIHEFFGRHAVLDGPGVHVNQAYSTAGLNPSVATRRFAQARGIDLNTVEGVQEMARYRVPEDVAKATREILKVFREPEEYASRLGQMIDAVNGAMRGSLTLPFLAFHARNLSSGQFVNASSGHIQTPADMVRYVKAVWDTRNVLRNPRSDLHREMMRAGVFQGERAAGFHGRGFMDVERADADKLVALMQSNPVTRPVGTGYGKVLDAGAWVMNRVEEYNRAPMYLYLRRKGFSPVAAAAEVEKLHFDYSRLTQFERQFMRRGTLFYCVPDHSEALTRDGWKTYDQIEFGEEILTFNVQKDCLEWQPCLEVAAFEHDEELLVWESKRHRLEFTWNHRWPIMLPPTSDTNLDGRTRTYQQRRKVVLGSHLTKGMHFICAAPLSDEEDSILTPEQARLLGWIVTDGTVQHRNPHWTPQARIYQSPHKFLDEVKTVAGGTAYTPHPETGVVGVAVKRDRLTPLLPYLNRDKLPRLVTRLSRAALEAMYDAMYKADGTTVEHRHQDYFAAQHQGVREAFQIICHLLGKRASQHHRGCYVSNRRHMGVKHGELKPQHYQGVVWCPRTENGTWVMRQNGTVVMTGNTFTRRMAPLMVETLAERPGGLMAQTLKATARARGEVEQPIPDYLEQTTAIPLGTTAQGDLRFFSGLGLPHEDVLSFAPAPFSEALSRTTPLIKAPVELAFKGPDADLGRSLFQRGRPLEDLDPSMGRIAENIRVLRGGEPRIGRAKPLLGSNVLEFLAANSPLSRALTTVRTATDVRKYEPMLGTGVPAIIPNLMTGVRVTDVSPAVQDAVLRERAQAAMRQLGGRSFTKVFIPEEEMAQLSPTQQLEAQRFNALMRELARRAKERKRARK